MTILALDSARETGWAHLYADGSVVSGTKILGPKDMNIGPVLLNFDAWLSRRICRFEVRHIFYEAPWVNKFTQQATVLYLFGLAGQIELAGFRNRAIVKPVLNARFIKHFTGGAPRDRKARKARTIAECIARGFNPKDDNEADALALLDFGCHDLHVEALPPGPLFAGGAV